MSLTFTGLSENASHICRNPASASYTSVGLAALVETNSQPVTQW